jgi:hypothetical protein
VGRIWKSLDKYTGASLDYYKQSLMVIGSSEDRNANRNADSEDHTHEISYGNKDSFGIRLQAGTC